MASWRRRARSSVFLAILTLAGAPRIIAAPLPDLFQKVKLRVAAGDYAGALETLKELDAEAAKPENERARAALRPAEAFYRGVCLASLGKAEEAREEFAVYISANPDKGIDKNAYSKKVVAAFEEARKLGRISGAEDVSALASAYRRTSYSRGDSAPPGPDWSSGPVKFLLTPDEVRSFSRIADDAGRAAFVSRFWLGPEPGASGKREDFHREFERRAAFADEHLSEGQIRGSLTDRGMVFILLGPPSAVVRRPIAAAEDGPAMLPMTAGANPPPRTPLGFSLSDQPSNWREVWRYNRDLLPSQVPYQQVDFAFQTRIDYGKNVLQREPAVLRTLDEARARWRAPAP